MKTKQDQRRRMPGESKSQWWERIGRDLAHDEFIQWERLTGKKRHQAGQPDLRPMD